MPSASSLPYDLVNLCQSLDINRRWRAMTSAFLAQSTVSANPINSYQFQLWGRTKNTWKLQIASNSTEHWLWKSLSSKPPATSQIWKSDDRMMREDEIRYKLTKQQTLRYLNFPVWRTSTAPQPRCGFLQHHLRSNLPFAVTFNVQDGHRVVTDRQTSQWWKHQKTQLFHWIPVKSNII